MIEFAQLTNSGTRMNVVLRTEFGELTLSFWGAWTSSFTDVSLEGDGWKVVAQSPETKAALGKALHNLTGEMFEKLRAIGSVSSTYQYEFLRRLDSSSLGTIAKYRDIYEMVKKTARKVLRVNGTSYLILPGRVGPALSRTFVKCEVERSGVTFRKAEVEWTEFEAALKGSALSWSEVSPADVWRETCVGMGLAKACRLLKELSEDGFRAISASVVAERSG